MIIIDGKKVSQEICAQLELQVEQFKSLDIIPTLAIIQLGSNFASNVYIRNKIRLADELGIATKLHKLPIDTTNDALLTLIKQLNEDAQINGILVQMPLPAHISEANIIANINPNKDVDCFHLENIGKL
jgi:methylenetetrahydrofolate dehydrogenase (NADP+)/methenyltetrahydrofolate cyclohydrolase